MEEGKITSPRTPSPHKQCVPSPPAVRSLAAQFGYESPLGNSPAHTNSEYASYYMERSYY